MRCDRYDAYIREDYHQQEASAQDVAVVSLHSTSYKK